MVYSSYLHIMHIQCCLIDKCKFINSIIKLGGQEVKVCFIDKYKTKTESHQVKGNKDKTISSSSSIFQSPISSYKDGKDVHNNLILSNIQ